MTRIVHPEFSLWCNGNLISQDQLADEFPSVYSFLKEWNDEQDFIQLKSSGSTGTPKSIRVSKVAMWHSAGTTISALKLSSSSRALLALSADYIAGKMMIVRAMRGGWKLELATPSTNVLAQVEGGFDFAALVPMQVETGLDELERIACIIIGGAPVGGALRQKLYDVKTQLFETYGMTETVSHIALKRIEPGNHFFTGVEGVRFSSSEKGELIIHADAWGHPELRTTDVVELKGDHQFKWLGRSDFVINSGGVKIHPETVERQIEEYNGIAGYLVGIPDDVLGEKCVFVSTDSRVEEGLVLDEIEVYKRPKMFFQIDHYPLTPTEKVSRPELREWVMDLLNQ